MLDAGAHVTPVWKQYLEGAGAVGDIPMAMMVPDIPGSLNLRHPDACQALLDAATDAGATVVRGVRDVTLAGGSSPTVTYGTNGQATELRATLVVGADGRASTVRKQAGITLDRQEPMSYIAGLLVDDLEDVRTTTTRSRARVTCSSWCSTNAVVARACICARACPDNIASRVGPEPSSSSRRATLVATRGVNR